MNISLKELRKSIVAIGYNIAPDKINIIGSGFCVDNEKYIVTCAHVYDQVPKEALNQLKAFVMIEEQKDYLEGYVWIPAKMVRKNNDFDLVILELENKVKTFLFPLELGDSDKNEVGDEVYLMGFPYAAQLINEGYGLTSHVSKTIISNIKRDGLRASHERRWIFFDTVNNPGNSGGPMIDKNTNKVIGVVSLAFRMPPIEKYKDLNIREPMHIGAAIPINLLGEFKK